MTTNEPGYPQTSPDWTSLDPQLADDRSQYSAARVRELIAIDRERAAHSREPKARNPSVVYDDFRLFAHGQGYDLTTCEEKGSITTLAGVGPATFWNDATEHAWRGWANRPASAQHRSREQSTFRASAMPGAEGLFQLAGRHLREVRMAQASACTCLTKTPDIEHHRQDCRYRIFGEIERFIAGLTRTTSEDLLKWARENELLLASADYAAIDAAVQRFIAAHAGDIAVQRYECTPKNGGVPFIIERAPDSWELRECDIRPAPPVDEPAPATAWTPGPGEVIAVCIDHALERAALLLRRTGYGGDAIDASRLEYLRQHPAAALPDVPDRALLCSMAVCLNHGFGLLPAPARSRVLDDMRKLYDEVAGRGYFRPDNRERYLAWLPAEREGN
ncbi:hypothetical protein DIE18_03155 [Burkholderia sp. Bp9125]|nr:hypothetical protein DIE18_03155 [Burkholderia sp. Bp9125]